MAERFTAYTVPDVIYPKLLADLADFGGVTVTDHVGGWVDGGGGLVLELSASITVVVIEDDPIAAWVRFTDIVLASAKYCGEDAVLFTRESLTHATMMST